MDQEHIPHEEDYSIPLSEGPLRTSDNQGVLSDLMNSHGFVRTIIATIAILLLSIPSIRARILRIISLPSKAIRILASVFEDNEMDTDMDIADDYNYDDDDEMEQDLDSAMMANAGFLRTFLISIRRLLNALLKMLSLVFEIRFGITGKIIVGRDRKVDSGNTASNVKGIASSVVAITKEKLAKKTLPNIIMPQINEREHLQEKNRIAKQQYDHISFDGDVEPAFLNDEDYPDDWMVYDPNQGKLVRKKDLEINMETALEIEKPLDEKSSNSPSINRIHVEVAS
jgi:hypothetical protein